MIKENVIIRIPIPSELKNSFQDEVRSKKLKLEENVKEAIQNGLDDDDIMLVMKKVLSVSSFSIFEPDQRVGFLKEFPKWLEFALVSFMRVSGVDVSDDFKKRDMYIALREVNIVLNSCGAEDLTIKELVKRASACFKTDFDEKCYLFVKLGLGFVDIANLCDVGYEAFAHFHQIEQIKKRYLHK